MQVINTSLLGDAQHIEQMDRQFHPSRQGQSVTPPASGADNLSFMQAWTASVFARKYEME